MVPREILGRLADGALKHSRVLLSASLLVLGAGCVTPLGRYMAWHPGDPPSQTTSQYDWRCVDTHGTVFYTNDPGVHDLTNVVTDPTITCQWVTAAENCAGAPPATQKQCLTDGQP